MKILIFALIFLVPPGASAGQAVKKQKANVEQRKAPASADAPIVLTTSAPNYCIFGGRSGKSFSGEAAFNSLVWRSDVVYVGETHDQPLDHLAQLAALKAMRIARGSKIAVGFEMLDQTLQPVLDDYAAGRITEEEFLARTDWKNEWGFDFALYRPVFDLVEQNKLRALALNVPHKVVAKIARAGLDGLTPEEKQYLPKTVEITKNKKYNDYLKGAFGGHGAGPMAKIMTLDNYLASMAAWNEGMGNRIAEFLNANPGYEVLVLAGNGHLMYNAAIPASVKSRVKDVRQASFYIGNAASCPGTLQDEDKDLANYIWYIDHPARPEAAAPANVSTAAAVTR